MLDKIRADIEEHKLLSSDKPVLVGLSGGADSVALLAVLVRLGYACVALHCNFHLRGEESDRDEAFSRSFSSRLNVPFYKQDFDTRAYASQKHISIEMAARDLRYEWFEEMRKRLGAQAIAVAHHQDDNIETLLINLLRGSGIRGLVGIRPKNGFVVRPLLGVSRRDILNWLAESHYAYIVDSSNLSDEYTRNFIRLRILPLLEELNPSVRKTLARTASHLSAAEEIYLSVIEKARKDLWKDGKISVQTLLSYPSPQTILYELLQPYGFSRQVVVSIFDSLRGGSGKKFYSPGYRLIKDRDSLLLYQLRKTEERIYSFKKSEVQIDSPISLSLSVVPQNQAFRLVPSKNIAYFDYDLLADDLLLRHWMKSDWFIPFGMKGRKKLSDYFSDHKYSLKQKEDAWLLCSGNDVIWLIGERSDNRYRITSSTKRILVVKKNPEDL